MICSYPTNPWTFFSLILLYLLADLMLSELDDWMSDDGSDGDEDKEGEEEEEDEDSMKKKKKKVQAKGRKQHGELLCFWFIPACYSVFIYLFIFILIK